ncbi:hypothetical protein ES703_88472 [subsurface metagenome]
MSENDNIKTLKGILKKFSDRFNDVTSALMLKFNEIYESITSIQKTLDNISEIQIQSDEYKKSMSGLAKDITELNQKVLYMPQISPTVIEEKASKPDQELTDVLDALDAMIEEKPKTMPKKVLKKKEPPSVLPREQPPPTPPLKGIPELDISLTPVPKLKQSIPVDTGLTPIPKLTPKLETSSKSQQEIKLQEVTLEEMTSELKDLAPKLEQKKKIKEPLKKIPEKILNIQSSDDIFYNLMIDIDLSENHQQLGSIIKLTSDLLKTFVKFHKVLFDMIKVASNVNREKGELTVEFKNSIKKKAEEWKKELLNI